jgi:hypothetical protein
VVDENEADNESDYDLSNWVSIQTDIHQNFDELKNDRKAASNKSIVGANSTSHS